MTGLQSNHDEVPDTAGIKKDPAVAIVILNWNGKNFLKQFLPLPPAALHQVL